MHRLVWGALLWGFLLGAEAGKKPHIIFIVADDLGWNDVSWNNPRISTPNLESLARDGVILNQSYVQAVCTPSRVSFMTGYYPYRVGRQNHVLLPLMPSGVPLRFPFLPEKLKEVGYSTHMIGKWHLGYCNLSYTPTMRGFDSFFGFYNGALDYFSHSRNAYRKDHIGKAHEDDPLGFDLRNNTKSSREHEGKYSTTLFADVSKDLLSTLSPDVPLFLFLSFQSVHNPVQVPKGYEDMYRHVKDKNRRKYSGMVTAMDDAVSVVVEELKNNGFWTNSLLVFTTDNGGQTLAGGNNWPLRGNKGTLWEGGNRAVTFVHGSILKTTGYVNTKLFHAVDWFPTLLKVAGAKPVSGIDGLDQWSVLSEDGDPVRSDLVYNIFDLIPPRAAIRVGPFKLIQGFPGKPANWIAPADDSDDRSIDCALKERAASPDIRLFDLENDPTERYNLAEQLPETVAQLVLKLEAWKERMIPANDPPPDEKGDPKLWGGSFSPGWCIAN